MIKYLLGDYTEIKKVKVKATKSKNFNNYSIEFEADIKDGESITQVANKLKERCNFFVNKWIGEVQEPSNITNVGLEHLEVEVPPTKVTTVSTYDKNIVVAISNRGEKTVKVDMMFDRLVGEEYEEQ